MRYTDYLDGANDNSPKKKRRYPQPIGNQSGSLGDAVSSGNYNSGPIKRAPRGAGLVDAMKNLKPSGTIKPAPRGSIGGDSGRKDDQMKKDAIRRRLGSMQKR